MNEVYHVFNKSIAGYKIFNDDSEYQRMISAIVYYQRHENPLNFSEYITSPQGREQEIKTVSDEDSLVRIIAYCLMPTHFHFILELLREDGISTFTSNLLNSYTRYFNLKHKRKGPLWEGRTKKVLIETNEQLIHLTRYLHLNPVTAHLVETSEKWEASSYKEYLGVSPRQGICQYAHVLEIDPLQYRKFVEDQISYQRELALVKHLILE